MDADTFNSAREAYRSGDYSSAAVQFSAAADEGEISGEVEHLRGNSLMHLGKYQEAAEAYGKALSDQGYGKRGALLTNQGKAYAAVGNHQAAADAFSAATQDQSYATPYKAYMGLGQSLQTAGRVAEAGTAYRQAAIDGANPAPAKALSNLGDCFVKLGRPQDAVESYRTALDFVTPQDNVNAIHAGMGTALAATGRAQDALESFGNATADGSYQLSDEQAAAHAQATTQVQNARNNLMNTGIGATGIDPLDPMGKSGTFMPDPSDTGFFDLSEKEILQNDRAEAKVRRKNRHIGLKVFLTLLIVLILAAAAAAFAYTQGFGLPTQEQAVEALFKDVSSGDTDKAKSELAPNISDDAKNLIVSAVPAEGTPKLTALDRSMTSSTGLVEVQLAKGGSATYSVSFARSSNQIGWAVSGLDIQFNSENGSANE